MLNYFRNQGLNILFGTTCAALLVGCNSEPPTPSATEETETTEEATTTDNEETTTAENEDTDALTDPRTNLAESEAEQYLGSLNRGQQASFLIDGAFLDSVAELDLGLEEETDNYSYKAHSASLDTEVQMHAMPKIDGIKSYVSGVFVMTSEGQEGTTATILCASEESGIPEGELPYPSLSDGEPTCPDGFTAI